MKKLKLILLILFVPIFSTKILAHVGLLYPVGGENFQVGQIIEIQWEIPILLNHLIESSMKTGYQKSYDPG